MRHLIDVHELMALLAVPDGQPALIDVRWSLDGPPGRKEFARGHIPGAHYVDLDTELAGPPGDGGRHPLPAPEVVGAALRRCGVDAATTVIVYDDRDSIAAARAWWVFRDVGVHTVRVLDGGLAAWVASGGPLAIGSTRRGKGAFTPSGPHLARLDGDGAAAAARIGVLLDARAPERYRGEVEPIDPIAGHIPGAVCAPTTDNLGPDGRFLGAVRLAARFAALGVAPNTTAACYCGSGVTAAHQLLALAVASRDGVLYPGSWSEWIRDPSRPVAPRDMSGSFGATSGDRARSLDR